jgi:hypothetical protein
LTSDPTVARLRETAAMLGEDIWIAVTLPGEFEGDDDLEDGTAIRRWTTVVLHPDELGWLREALALNAADTRTWTRRKSSPRGVRPCMDVMAGRYRCLGSRGDAPLRSSPCSSQAATR